MLFYFPFLSIIVQKNSKRYNRLAKKQYSIQYCNLRRKHKILQQNKVEFQQLVAALFER